MIKICINLNSRPDIQMVLSLLAKLFEEPFIQEIFTVCKFSGSEIYLNYKLLDPLNNPINICYLFFFRERGLSLDPVSYTKTTAPPGTPCAKTFMLEKTSWAIERN